MRLHRIPGATQGRRKPSPLIIIIIIVTALNLCVDFEVIQPQLTANSACRRRWLGGCVWRACGPVGSLTRALAGGGVQIYTPRFCERNRACRHPRAVSHLLPTYINSSESSSKIDAQIKPKKQTQQECNRSGRARQINLSLSPAPRPEPLSLPAATAGRTDGRTGGVLKQC